MVSDPSRALGDAPGLRLQRGERLGWGKAGEGGRAREGTGRAVQGLCLPNGGGGRWAWTLRFLRRVKGVAECALRKAARANGSTGPRAAQACWPRHASPPINPRRAPRCRARTTAGGRPPWLGLGLGLGFGFGFGLGLGLGLGLR